MSQKILITGKNSYIGTSVETWLNKSPEDFLIETIDTRDNAWKEADFSNYDVVFHVAGIAHANAKEDERDLYYKVNTELTVEIAKHAKSQGIKQFIFMSSAIVYTSSRLKDGLITRDTVPYSEDPYGDSKIKAEEGILPLQDNNFNVVVLRPPMIYGKGSKGNYPKLAKLAKITPVFPDYNNKRSMLHIENLAEFIRLIILNKDKGIFWPQNPEYTKTSEMVRYIAEVNNKKIYLIKIMNPIINLVNNHAIVNKVFGNLYYDMEMSNYNRNEYQINDLRKSIIKTES